MKIWAKVTEVLHTDKRIQEHPDSIALNYILNKDDSLEIAGDKYTVLRRLLFSQTDPEELWLAAILILSPDISNISKTKYQKLFAHIFIKGSSDEKESFFKSVIIKNKTSEIRDFITSVPTSFDEDFIKTENDKYKKDDDLFCRLLDILKDENDKITFIVSDEKYKKVDLCRIS